MVSKWTTTYSDGPTEYEAVQVPWGDVTALLGHPHEGSAEDDESLICALMERGAPKWVRDAVGWTDEHGWGLIGPAMLENPLRGLRDDFVERWEHDGMLRVRPIAPKPDELALFHSVAIDAGFRPGPERVWGNERFPSYYYRPLDEQVQRDWEAVAWFQREARKCNEMGELDKLAQFLLDIDDDIYQAQLDTGRNWCMTIYRDEEEVETVTLP
jgi:hypothetical protein